MFDFEEYVESGFAHTGPRNPLRTLTPEDKIVLVSLLTLYLEPCPPEDAAFEQAAETATHASALAERIHQLLGTYFAQALQDVLGDFHDLPMRLKTFSLLFGGLCDQLLGKRGHQGRLWKNQFLVMASEFIRHKTNRYNDEHLAELIQAINPSSDLADFSGDAIHKRRQNLKRTYPLAYACLFNKVCEFRNGVDATAVSS